MVAKKSEGFFQVWNLAVDAALPVVGPTAFGVFILLSRMANKEGQCWPSRRYIAAKVGVSVSTVKRALDTLSGADGVLMAEGLPPMIRVENRWSEKGDPTSNLYTLLVR